MEVLKLEVGKTYVNSLGYPVKIVKYGINNLLFEGDNKFIYTEEGKVYLSYRSALDHKQCLVSEVESLPYAIMLDFMLDIETMSTDDNALITTISIVRFDLSTGDLGTEYEIGLNWNEQIKHKAHICPDTVQWWLKQDKEAIDTMLRIPQQKVDVVLDSINHFFKTSGLELKYIKLWGNGKEFDNIKLRNLFKRHGKELVVPYWCDNDVRTLVNLSNINTRDFKFEGIKHRGIDDCKHQINYCSYAYRVLKSL